MRTILTLLACYIYAAPLHALPLYAELGYMYNYVEAASTELNPTTTKLMVGTPLNRSTTFELVYAHSLSEDKLNALRLGIDNIQAVYLRFHSSLHTSDADLSLFLGRAMTTISTSNNGVNESLRFEDFSWGIGLEERSKSFNNLYYSLEYTQFYDDHNLSLSGVSLGVKYTF